MGGSLNKVMLIGRLGRDPEVKYLASGQAVATFSMATDEKWTNKEGKPEERTEWHAIVVWGKLAEICGEYLAKGRQVYIEGRLQTRDWTDQNGQKRYKTEIVAQTMVMLGSKGTQGTQGPQGPAEEVTYDQPPADYPNNSGPKPAKPAPPEGGGDGGGGGGSEDDIPF